MFSEERPRCSLLVQWFSSILIDVDRCLHNFHSFPKIFFAFGWPFIYVLMEVTCPPPPPPPYLLLISILLPLPVTTASIRPLPPPPVVFALKSRCFVRSYPKKIEKTSTGTLLLKIRSTPIALAALPADCSIFSVPPLWQFSFENQRFSKDVCSNPWFSEKCDFLDHHWNLEVSFVKRMICQD